MLDLIRRYRALFSIVFVMAALGLIMSDFGRQVTGMNMGMGAGIVARVDGEDIKTTEFSKIYERTVGQIEEAISEQSAGNPEQLDMMRKIYMMQANPENLLNRLIEQKFREATARAEGIEASPARIREALAEYEVFQSDGRFDPVRYKNLLAANGLRPADFEESIAGNLRVQALDQAFRTGMTVQSELEVSMEKDLKRGRIFEVAAISPRALPEPKTPGADALKVFTEDLNQRIHFETYYNDHIEEFRKSEAVEARHILFADNAEGKAKAEEVLKQLKAGSLAFEEAAKTHSLDKSNANRGGDLGFFERGVMDPAFEKAAFEIVNPNDFAPVVKSSFGFHIIQLQQKRAATERNLESVLTEIAPKVWAEAEKKKGLQEKLAQWAKSPNGPSAADLKIYKAEWKELPPWTPMDDRLGPYSGMASSVGDLIDLGAKKPFLSKALEKGGQWILVRWKKDAAAEKAADAEGVDSQKKYQEALGFYFENRYKTLEKQKKIVRSDQTLARFREDFSRRQQ